MHIPFDDFVAQIEEQTTIVSSRGKEYEIESVADGVVTVLNPDVVINCRKRIKLDDLYQAYLALDVKQLSTSKVRQYVKTGAAEATALLMNVFGYKVLEDALGEVIKGMAIEDKLDIMASMPFTVGLSATFGSEGLVRMAYALGLINLSEYKEKDDEELQDSILEYVFQNPQKVIERLPLVDLEVLKALNTSVDIMYANTPLPLLLVDSGLASTLPCDANDDEAYVLRVNNKFMDTVRPYIDEAIAKKKATKDPVMEQAFRGILNIYGAIDADKALDILIETLPPMDKDITSESIRKFCKDSMLVRFSSDMKSKGRVLVWMDEFEASLASYNPPHIRMYQPKNAAVFLAFGNYPYLIPYKKEQKKFYDFLSKRLGTLEASRLYTIAFYNLQDSDPKSNKAVLMDMMETVSRKSKIKGEYTNRELQFFTDAFNSFPRVFFKGHSPADLNNKN